MRVFGRALKTIAGIAILIRATVIAFLPASTGNSLAQLLPLPSERPIPTWTNTPVPPTGSSSPTTTQGQLSQA